MGHIRVLAHDSIPLFSHAVTFTAIMICVNLCVCFLIKFSHVCSIYASVFSSEN